MVLGTEWKLQNQSRALFQTGTITAYFIAMTELDTSINVILYHHSKLFQIYLKEERQKCIALRRGDYIGILEESNDISVSYVPRTDDKETFIHKSKKHHNLIPGKVVVFQSIRFWLEPFIQAHIQSGKKRTSLIKPVWINASIMIVLSFLYDSTMLLYTECI